MIKLEPFQIEGANFLASRFHAANGDEPGCLSGDTKLKINRNGLTSAYSLAHLYAGFNHLPFLMGNRHGTKTLRDTGWNTEPTYCKSLGVDGILRLNRIVQVVNKGIRSVVRVSLASGKSICLTPDHEICGKEGWIAAGNLRAGNIVLTNGLPLCASCGSSNQIVTYPFAKFKGYCRKCVYRKFRKKPNFITGRF